jgi:hypothetical protein
VMRATSSVVTSPQFSRQALHKSRMTCAYQSPMPIARMDCSTASGDTETYWTGRPRMLVNRLAISWKLCSGSRASCGLRC